MKHNIRCICGSFLKISSSVCKKCGYDNFFVNGSHSPDKVNMDTGISDSSCEDARKKLPLVMFSYPDSQTKQPRKRYVWLTRMDAQNVQGLEVEDSWQPASEGTFKTFKITKLIGLPQVLEFVQ